MKRIAIRAMDMYNRPNMRVKLRQNESGLAAFVVTSFMIIMLSLLVLAFSQSSRREQRQALDRQLSSQAFYTAESAVQETAKHLRNPDATTNNTNCDLPDNAKPSLSGLQADDSNFKFSCILWDKNPTTITYDNLDVQGKVVSLQTDSGANVNTVTIKWTDTAGTGADLSGCDSVSTAIPARNSDYPSNCGPGMIRVLLMPYSDPNTQKTRDELADSTYTAFLAPQNGISGGNIVYKNNTSVNYNEQGKIHKARCQNGACEATITQVPKGINHLQIKSVYSSKPVNVEITANIVTGEPAKFSDAQYMIDATVRVADVVKRVKAYVERKPTATQSSFIADIQNGICKNFSTAQNTSIPTDTSCDSSSSD